MFLDPSYLVNKFQHPHYAFQKRVWYSFLSSQWGLFQTAMTFQIRWGNLATASANSLRALKSIRCHRLVSVQVYQVASNLIFAYYGRDFIPPVPGVPGLERFGKSDCQWKVRQKIVKDLSLLHLGVTTSPALFIMVGDTFSLVFPFCAMHWYELNRTWKTRNSNIVLLMVLYICLPLN